MSNLGEKLKRLRTQRLMSLVYLAFGVFGHSFTFAIYGSTYTNFLVEDLNISAFQMGALESIREVPGLLCAFILGSIIRFPQTLLAGSFLIIFGIGIGGVSTVGSWIQVVIWSIIWSIGFHSWMPLASSITLGLSDREEEGKRLGQFGSISSIASMTAMASVAVFSSIFPMRFRLFFILAGFISIFGGLMVFRIPPTKKIFQRNSFVIKKRYNVYYLLNLLEGARRMLFQTFAPFALVKVYGLDIKLMALLMFSSSALTFMASPQIGKFVDRLKPRTMLTFSYILMIVDFLGYAFIRNVNLLLFLYILNSILSIVSHISQTKYINSLSSIADLTPNLAMGQTMNHISAVILPLTCGVIWDIFGYEATFLIGVAVAVCSLITSQKIKYE